MKTVAWLWLAVAATLAMGVLCPPQALAQVPGRFYWKTLSDANAVPVIFNSLSGNTNPFDPSHTVTPGASFDATMAIAGYARTFSLFDRAAMAAVLLPMGRISGEATVAGRTFNQSASGFGDPMIEFNINLLGPPAPGTTAANPASTALRERSSTTSASGSRSGTRSTITSTSPSATRPPSTTTAPGTFAWTASWSRSCSAGTRSSKAHDG